MSKKGHRKGGREPQKNVHNNKYAAFSHANDAQARILREMEKAEADKAAEATKREREYAFRYSGPHFSSYEPFGNSFPTQRRYDF